LASGEEHLDESRFRVAKFSGYESKRGDGFVRCSDSAQIAYFFTRAESLRHLHALRKPQRSEGVVQAVMIGAHKGISTAFRMGDDLLRDLRSSYQKQIKTVSRA